MFRYTITLEFNKTVSQVYFLLKKKCRLGIKVWKNVMEFILDWFDSIKLYVTEVACAPSFLVSLFIKEMTDTRWSLTEAINQVKLSTTVV